MIGGILLQSYCLLLKFVLNGYPFNEFLQEFMVWCVFYGDSLRFYDNHRETGCLTDYLKKMQRRCQRDKKPQKPETYNTIDRRKERRTMI